MTTETLIRPARPDDTDDLAQAFYAMWQDNGMTTEHFKDDWKDVTLAFMAESAETKSWQSFVAEHDGHVVGTAQCQLTTCLYPQALKKDIRLDGYIWGVYVAPDFRRGGLATKLTRACVEYLKSLGCTRVVLHASKTGAPVYARLGFYSTNEMRLDV